MSNTLSVTGDILPACDLCHSRKVKCNRQAPCANCADAGAECRRERSQRPYRKRTNQNLLTPQESVLEFGRPSRSQRLNPPPEFGTEESNPDIRFASEQGQIETENSTHESVEVPPSGTAPSTASAVGSNYHAIQAKNVIQLELGDSSSISRERQSILKDALQCVSSIAETEPRDADAEELYPSDPAITVPDTPPRELLFMLLRGPPESVRIEWPDHISDKTYERMASTLLQADSQSQTQSFHQYCVCIYVKGIFHLYQSSRITDSRLIKKELLQSRSAYIAATIRSIEHFNILCRPNLSSIQCLISSALLMQHLGRLHQCWTLTSYAARQIVSLNYHKIRRLQANSEQEQEIYSALYWCFYLDRTLSSLLCRPPSLPELEVSPTDLIILDPSSPYEKLLRILLDLAQVQGKLHGISCAGSNVSDSRIVQLCQDLESNMQSILPRLQSSRTSLPRLVQYDWVAVDFCYYAIFVEIHRTRLKSAFSPLVHRECLVYARKSLRAFHFLQRHIAKMPGFDDPYPSFLTWTLFLYPLSAFFVVFCNIIGTLDQGDYELMRQITRSLVPFAPDPHLGRLLNLLRSLEKLCEPLFQEKGGDTATEDAVLSNVDVPNTTSLSATDNGSGGIATTGNTYNPETSFNDDIELGNESMPSTELDFSTDWLMWQLFNSQVPTGWLNTGVDPFDVQALMTEGI